MRAVSIKKQLCAFPQNVELLLLHVAEEADRVWRYAAVGSLSHYFVTTRGLITFFEEYC